MNDDRLVGKGPRIFMELILLLTFIGLVISIGGGIYLFKTYTKDAPKITQASLNVSVPSKILDNKGKLITKVGFQNRIVLQQNDVPQQFTDALVSTEDKRFYQEHGFDPIRIVKAAVLQVTNKLHITASQQGGSTLTQQLIKLTTEHDKDTLKRKVQEIYLAYNLEQEYSKSQILNMYENKVFMGNGVYGIGAAAEYYYNKPLKKLSLDQIAVLAGMPNNPMVLNPYASKEYTKQRRDNVLYSMYMNKKISKEEMLHYASVSIMHGVVPKNELHTSFGANDNYNRYLNNVIKEAKELVGAKELYNGGLTVRTALDRDKQWYANKAVTTNKVVNWGDKNLMSAFVMLDTKTGRVVAESGGDRNTNWAKDQYDYATAMGRQAGSTMKPILAYGPAIQYLNYTTGTMIKDSPFKYRTGASVNDWDNQYWGSRTMRDNLAGSRNIPAVRTLDAVGLTKAYNFANDLGFNYAKGQMVESGVIGGVSNANPLKVAQAYAAFGNGGNYNKGHFITSITDSSGASLYLEPKGNKVMNGSTAYMVTDMLRSTINNQRIGTATAAKLAGGRDLAGKTGTTNYTSAEQAKWGFTNSDVPDAWFAGYNSKYTIAVWTGYNTREHGLNRTQQKYSQRLAKALFDRYMGNSSGRINKPSTVSGSDGGTLTKND